MDEPRIDVLMVNCNHESTLAESIASVLGQTWKNLRLIVVDDGSTDGSCAVVESFMDDPRVELRRLPENRHICAATNYGFGLVSAEWLARIDSDDVWYPERLERQMAALAARPDVAACFSWCDFIDENGNDASAFAADLPEALEPTYQTRREWLRHFYYRCNCLIHSSVLMRTSVMRETGGFELAYRQLHDFDYWVRIVRHHDILVLPERLVAMRKFVGDGSPNENASLANIRNITRTFNEFLDIRAHFFDDLPKDTFLDAFREDFVRPDSSTPEELACERALLLCRPQDNWDVGVTPAGLRALKGLYANEKTAELLRTRYDMPLQRFYELATESVYNDLVVKNDLRAARELTAELRGQADELRGSLDALNGEIASLREHVHALEALADGKDVELEGLRGRVRELEGSLGRRDAELAELRGSTSWKITRPLRALGSLAHGGTRGAEGSPAAEANADQEGEPAAAPESIRRRVVVQAHLSGNLGDDLFVRTLCARYPDVDFLIATEGDYAGRLADIPNLKLRPIEEFGTLVSTADAAVHISGSCFIRDRKNFDAFFAADSFLADHARKSYVIGANFGPYEDESILEAYRGLFRRYDGIVFRDRYSAGLFSELPNVACAPDVLFGYPATVREKRRRAVVCPISLEGREGTFGISEYATAYRSFSLDVIRALLAHGYEVTLASFNESQGDELEIEALLAGLSSGEREGVTCARYRTRPEEVVRELEDAECVVATRFHAMVLGIVHGCRVLPVIYDQKTEKVLEDLAYPLAVRLDELAGADAEALVERLLVTEPVDVAPLAAGAEGQFQFLDQLLR